VGDTAPLGSNEADTQKSGLILIYFHQRQNIYTQGRLLDAEKI